MRLGSTRGGGTLRLACSLAAGAGIPATVSELLAAGADANARDDRGVTPLLAAAGKGHLPIVQLLLRKFLDHRCMMHGVGSCQVCIQWDGTAPTATV